MHQSRQQIDKEEAYNSSINLDQHSYWNPCKVDPGTESNNPNGEDNLTNIQ